MKIYIVTRGCYSGYYIDKVFTDKNKAEEYRKWCSDANDLEVYDTEDNYQVEGFYGITVNYCVNDDGRNKDPIVNINKYNSDEVFGNYIRVLDRHKYGRRCVDICMKRYIPEENWNEDFYRNKCTKAIYDIAAITKQKLFEGFTDDQINRMFNETLND